jgi:hypothetical protein
MPYRKKITFISPILHLLNRQKIKYFKKFLEQIRIISKKSINVSKLLLQKEYIKIQSIIPQNIFLMTIKKMIFEI